MSTALTFDASQSHLRLETRAKGMLAKLAHDLSITAGELACKASVDGGKLTLDLDVRVAGLHVDGVRKSGHVDKSVLSTSDRSDIERKIREEVLRAPSVVVKASCEAPASLFDDGTHDLAATLSVEVGRGRADVRTRATVTTSAEKIVAKGTATVSMPSLGLAPVKGPLGAFRVDDDIEIAYELAFSRG